MKIKLNEKALRIKMAENNIKSYCELCRESGVSYKAFMQGKKRLRLSSEIYWLFSDFLGCHIEELQQMNWGEE